MGPVDLLGLTAPISLAALEECPMGLGPTGLKTIIRVLGARTIEALRDLNDLSAFGVLNVCNKISKLMSLLRTYRDVDVVVSDQGRSDRDVVRVGIDAHVLLLSYVVVKLFWLHGL